MTVTLPQILSCGCSRDPRFTPDHVHPGVELILVERGAASLETAVGTLSGGPGTLFVLPPGSHHDQRSPPGSRTWYLVASADGHLDVALPDILALPDQDPLRSWLPDLIRLHEAEGQGDQHRYLLAGILHRVADHRAGAAAAPLPPPLQRLIRAIRADPLRDPDLAGLADLAGVSASHLRALFARHVGTSPREWCRLQRLQIAQKLLRSSFLDIAEIAAQSGWSDPNYFTRYFRSRTGLSPRAWRRQHAAVNRGRRHPWSPAARRGGGR